MLEAELDWEVLDRSRYARRAKRSSEQAARRRQRSPPRPPVADAAGNVRPAEDRGAARQAETPDGKTTEWKSKALRAYQRRTLAADALIAGGYLSGTNRRRVRRALASLFGGAVGKDTVSRVWRKVKSDWDAWSARSFAEEPIVRPILDGTVVRVRLDRKRPPSRCSSCSGCARTAKRCCWQSRAWAARIQKPGGRAR